MVGKVIGHFQMPGAWRGLAAPTPIALIYLGEDADGHPSWKTVGEFRYTDPVLGVMFVVPDGYTFDLASSPRAVWWFVSPFDDSIAAPLLHDSCYGRKGDMRKSTAGPGDPYAIPDARLTQKQTDDMFYRVMILEGVNPKKAWASWLAVRTFGSSMWSKHPDPPP